MAPVRAGLAGLLLLSCLSLWPGPAQAQGEPIRIGAVSTLTGPATLPESAAAAKAVFEQFNAAGGLRGRKIEFISEDDKFDPNAAAQAARRLVDEREVLALAGSAGIMDCAVNAAFYRQRDVAVIPGLGVDGACFASPNIAPVNVGPFATLAAGLLFATGQLKRERVCLLTNAQPAMDAGNDAAIARWEKASGRKLVFHERSIRPTDDFTALALRAKSSGCQAVVFNGIEPQVMALVKAIDTQKVGGIDWITLSPAYTGRLAQAVGQAGDGLYSVAEFEPFSGDAPALKDWRELMNASGQPLNSLSQGGYIAAKVVLEALGQVQGPVTRGSLRQALQAMPPYQSPMMGDPWKMTGSGGQNPNRSVKIVRIRNGQWTNESGDRWLKVDR